jgi:hypothetical protein
MNLGEIANIDQYGLVFDSAYPVTILDPAGGTKVLHQGKKPSYFAYRDD